MQDRRRPEGAGLQRGRCAAIPFLAVACLLSLAAVSVARAQVATVPNSSTQGPAASPAGTFGRVEASAQRQLADSMTELTRLREEIMKEKLPLSKQLSELEDQLSEAKRQYQQTTRLLDSRTLDLTNLRSEIQTSREENNYLSTLLSQYIENFVERLHIAEMQRYREVLDKARLAAENSALSEAEVYREQMALVNASLERLQESLGGVRFDGSAVDSSGLVKPGAFVLIGPAALFRSADGQSVGTAEVRIDSLEPTVVPFEDPALTEAAAELVASGAGQFPFDPTLGNAHKIEATRESLLAHVQKGGPVMIPILILAAAALSVALFKWVTLTRIRNPSDERVLALLRAIAEHDEGSARARAKAIGGPTGEMLRVGVEHLHEPPELIEEMMYEKVLTTRLKVQRFLPFISISAASAPLLGLLGTVTGIISTFKLLTVFGAGDVKSLSGGISEALITTEFGLIVAIPSLLLHAFLSRKARGVIDRMEKAATAFTNQINKSPWRRDDTQGLLARMPAIVAREVVRALNHRGRPQSEELVSYSDRLAGSVMKPPVITVAKDATVSEAVARIRDAGIDEDFHTIFVVDEHGRYVGQVLARLLLTHSEHTRIESLVDPKALFVRVDTDREEVKTLFREHNVAAMPVLDQDDRLVGRITRNGE